MPTIIMLSSIISPPTDGAYSAIAPRGPYTAKTPPSTPAAKLLGRPSAVRRTPSSSSPATGPRWPSTNPFGGYFSSTIAREPVSPPLRSRM